VVPKSAPIGMVYDPNNLNSAGDVRDAQAAAAALGRTLIVAKVAAEGELDTAVAGLVQQRIGALFVAPNANFRIWRNRLIALAARHGLPASYSTSEFVRIGGLMAYGPDQLDIYLQAGTYLARLLKGEKPADMPIAQPTKFEFIVNLKTAKALGLTIPPSLLLQADQIVE
jgi:putative ABC transport system substrate-binding protein